MFCSFLIVHATALWWAYTVPPVLPVPLSPWQATAVPCPHKRSSNMHRQVWLSLLWQSLLLSLGPRAHKVLFVPSKSLWWIWGLILNMTAPTVLFQLLLCPWTWGIFFFLVGSSILLSMVVQQLIVILVFLQEKMNSCPSAPSSCWCMV